MQARGTATLDLHEADDLERRSHCCKERLVCVIGEESPLPGGVVLPLTLKVHPTIHAQEEESRRAEDAANAPQHGRERSLAHVQHCEPPDSREV